MFGGVRVTVRSQNFALNNHHEGIRDPFSFSNTNGLKLF